MHFIRCFLPFCLLLLGCQTLAASIEEDALERFVQPLNEWKTSNLRYSCDVNDDGELSRCFGDTKHTLIENLSKQGEVESVFITNAKYSAALEKQELEKQEKGNWKLKDLNVFDDSPVLFSGKGGDAFYLLMLYRLDLFASEQPNLELISNDNGAWIYERKKDAKPIKEYSEESIYRPLKRIELFFDPGKTFPKGLSMTHLLLTGGEKTTRYELGNPVQTAIGLLPSSSTLIFDDGFKYTISFTGITFDDNAGQTYQTSYVSHYGIAEPEPKNRSSQSFLSMSTISILMLLIGVLLVGSAMYFKRSK